jgi:hypothetical protein
MPRWLTELVEAITWIPRAARNGARFGRVFRLRDRGHLNEALQEALALAHDLLEAPRDFDKPSVMFAASTVDEIAQRLGTPEAAREILERALVVAEQEWAEIMTDIRPNARDYRSQVDASRRRFRERLTRLRQDR